MDDLFTRLGLTAKERETFLKLLPLGAQPISVIAKRVGIPRSSMYIVVEKLKERRLVETFERVGIRYVKCIPAKDIANVLRVQERSIRETLEMLQEELPALEAMEGKGNIAPSVKFWEGKDAVMKMYESFAHEKELCAFFNPQTVKRLMPAYLAVTHEAVREYGARAREIAVDSPEARAYRHTYASERHEIRLLPHADTLLSDCLIARDRIAMVSYAENAIVAMEMFSASLAATQRILFEYMWKGLA